MELTLYKILVPLAALCMIAKVVSRFRRNERTIRELVAWIMIWSGISFTALFPDFTLYWFSVVTGIKSGFYALIFLLLVVLLYGYLFLFVKLEDTEHMLTELVRTLALRGLEPSLREQAGLKPQAPPSSTEPVQEA